MAGGALTAGAVSGGTAGLAFGPIGAAVGAAGGWLAGGGIKNLFGHKKKAPVPVAVPWYRKPTDLEILGFGVFVVVLVVLIKRKG